MLYNVVGWAVWVVYRSETGWKVRVAAAGVRMDDRNSTARSQISRSAGRGSRICVRTIPSIVQSIPIQGKSHRATLPNTKYLTLSKELPTESYLNKGGISSKEFVGEFQ